MSAKVIVERDEAVPRIVMNRPDKNNALDRFFRRKGKSSAKVIARRRIDLISSGENSGPSVRGA